MPLRPGPLLLRVTSRAARRRAGTPEYKTKPCRYAASSARQRGRPLPVRAHGPRGGVPRHTESRVCVTTLRAESAAVARARDDASCRWRGLARHHRRGDDASADGAGLARYHRRRSRSSRLGGRRRRRRRTRAHKTRDGVPRIRRGHVPLRRELLLRAQRRSRAARNSKDPGAVDAKAGRSRAGGPSGRASPTSRRASRPTS